MDRHYLATISHFLFDIKQIRHNHAQLKFGTITYSSRFIRNLNWRRQNCTISGETDIKMSIETGVGTLKRYRKNCLSKQICQWLN